VLGVDDLAARAADDGAAHGLHAGVERRHPLLLDLGHYGGLAGFQALGRLAQEVASDDGDAPVVQAAGERSVARADHEAHRPAEQAEKAAGDQAHARAERALIRGLLDGDLAVGVLGDHRIGVQGHGALGVQLLEDARPVVRLLLSVEYNDLVSAA
jgi:hypothetical protein